ncbi:MAG: TIGR01440 family protein [Clostridia bacterium]|nr:TIGR01440 family protein [Clostridia bacterium]
MTFFDLEKTAYEAAKELLGLAKVPSGGIMVIGCSSSEVCGGQIGHASSPETADALYRGIRKAADEAGVYTAAQCCEHLNRAVVVERAAVAAGIAAGTVSPVNAVPQPKAGGSFASAAYREADDPVVLEHIKADCGLDIGGTLIGMHLKEVAVPVRLSVKTIGEANLIAARTRPKFIGGCRAVYDEEKM